GVVLLVGVLIGPSKTSLLGTQHEQPGDSCLLRLLATDASAVGDGALSPDSKSIVLASKRSGHVNLWLFHVDSEEWEQLTDSQADDFEPQWSPDGSMIAFTSSRGGHKQIWLLEVSTRRLRQLTFSEDEDDYPCWSPDGKVIAFTGGPWKRR